MSANSYIEAINLAQQIIEQGSAVGFSISRIDIGGGYPGSSNNGIDFKQVNYCICVTEDMIVRTYCRLKKKIVIFGEF